MWEVAYYTSTKCSGCKTHPHCALLPCVCHCRKKRHARSKTFGFTYIKLRFLVFSCYEHVRLLFLMDLAINQHHGATVNSIHASFIVYSLNGQSLFTVITELQYLTNYST